MRKSPEDIRSAEKKISRTLILYAALFFSLQAFILNPLYVFTSSDVRFAITPMPEIIGILNDISYPLGYALSFAAVTYSIFKFSLARSKRPIAILSLAFFLRYVANYIMSSVAEGGIRPSDIPSSILLPFAFDMLQFAIIGIVVCVKIKSYYKDYISRQKANTKLNKKTPSIHDEVFEDQKIISLKNPLHYSAIATGVVLSATKIFTRVIYDLSIGAPTSTADTIWMVAYYLSDILIAVLVYVASLLLFSKLEAKTAGTPTDYTYHT